MLFTAYKLNDRLYLTTPIPELAQFQVRTLAAEQLRAGWGWYVHHCNFEF